MIDNHRQNAPVYLVQALPVHIHACQGPVCHFLGYAGSLFFQGIVAHPAQVAVGNARRTPGPSAYFKGSFLINVYAQDAGTAADDGGEVLRAVKIDMQHDAKAAAQRSRHKPHARGGPDKGKPVQGHFHGACCRPLPYHDVQLEIFHGRIEHFLHGNGHAVDLVHKQYVVGRKIGKDGCKIPGPFQHGAGDGDNVDAKLRCHNLGQRRLAKARIAVEDSMVKPLAKLPGSPEKYLELGPHILLADKLIQRSRPDIVVKMALFPCLLFLCHKLSRL